MRKILFIAVILALLAAGCARDFETIKVRVADESDGPAAENLQRIFAERVVIEESGADQILADALACYQRKLYGSGRVLVESHLLEEPSDWRAHFVLGLLDIADEDFQSAEKCFQAALRFAPSEASYRAIVYLGLGRAMERGGQLGLSAQHYVTALNLDSSLTAARDGLDRLTPLSSVEPR